jgi:hypothetical protein
VVEEIPAQEVANLGVSGSLRRRSVGIHSRDDERATSHVSYYMKSRWTRSVCVIVILMSGPAACFTHHFGVLESPHGV